jgi:cytoplasmic iron level regulating protein YaaA (DUF328/UPF0246 family)
MLIVISPAKSFSKEVNAPNLAYTQPQYLEDAKKLMAKLQGFSKNELAELMNLSEDLAIRNTERHLNWQPPFTIKNANPAIFAFTGEVYRGLDAKTLKPSDLTYSDNHLRILSGLYGVLKPLDLIQPYRLEIGAKLTYYRNKNLYQFWGDTLTNAINQLLKKEKYLINLASNEYFKALNRKKLEGVLITPVFKDFSNGQYKSLMTYAKHARGEMSRYIIQERIEDPELLKEFNGMGYCYSPDMSDETTIIFIRG